MKKFVSLILAMLIAVPVMSISMVCAMAATYTEVESNDLYSSADTVLAGNQIKGTIGKSGDKDYYKIIASSNGKLTITFKHTYGSSSDRWNVKTYYYSSGTYYELSSNNVAINGSESVTLPIIGAVANGVYFVSVETIYTDTIGREYTVATSFTSTNYREKEINDSFQTATAMTSDNTYGGCLGKSGDKDYYKITAESSGTINFSFKHSYGSSGDRWRIRIYDYSNAGYNELSEKNVAVNGNETVALTAVGAVANRTYYVLVDTIYTDTIGYEYSISVTSSSTASLSLSKANITLSKGETETISCSYNGTILGGAQMAYNIGDTNVVSAVWGDWSNKSAPLTLNGLKGGTTTVRIYLKDYSKDEVVDYKDITITVIDDISDTSGGENNQADNFSILSWFSWLINLINMIINWLF